jgi:hypothetical protein
MPLTLSQIQERYPQLSPEEEKEQLTELFRWLNNCIERNLKSYPTNINIVEEKAAIAGSYT